MGYRVGIIGPEASGKSTLARYLANRYQGLYVPEYARDYIERKGAREVSYEELCQIAHHQIEEMARLYAVSEEREGDVLYLAKPVFFDTELIVTKIWFEEAFECVPEWLEEAIRQYPMDVYLLTTPDLPWTQDGARYNGSDEKRQALFDRYEQAIQALDIPYYIITHH